MDNLKTCFVICPIGQENSDTRTRSNTVYEHILKPVADQKQYTLKRADKIYQADTITETVINELNTSDLVIADITEANPNVYYELGYRTALKKPIIQIARKNTQLPFDISTKRTYFYDETNLSDSENFKTMLLMIIDNIEDNLKNKTNISSKSSSFGDTFAEKFFENMLSNPDKIDEYANFIEKISTITK